jgi:hypothetical protein
VSLQIDKAEMLGIDVTRPHGTARRAYRPVPCAFAPR